MYIFGLDIPVVEITLLVGVIGIILAVEIIVALLLIIYHMRNTKRLEDKINALVDKLVKLESQELKELSQLEDIDKKRKEHKR